MVFCVLNAVARTEVPNVSQPVVALAIAQGFVVFIALLCTLLGPCCKALALLKAAFVLQVTFPKTVG